MSSHILLYYILYILIVRSGLVETLLKNITLKE